MHLVGFIIRIYHNAQPLERQNNYHFDQKSRIPHCMQWWHNQKNCHFELVLRLSCKTKQLHLTIPAHLSVETPC